MSDFNDKLRPYLQLMRLDRPIGTLLLLWPTLWALFAAAGGRPPLAIALVFVAGVVLMRAAGCVANDIADRKFDGHVRRTAQRPLAKGRISVGSAVLLLILLLLLASGLLWLLRPLTVKLAAVAAFFAITYPFMKRLTYLPQVYLGIAFAWSIPMAYAEIQGRLIADAWLLFVANILWTTAYDTIYAMVDRKDDVKIGVKSTAILFADLDKVFIGILQFMTLGTLALFGHKNAYHEVYFLGLVAMAATFIWQQYLIRDRKEDDCFKAFLFNNYSGLVVCIGLAVNFLLKSTGTTP